MAATASGNTQRGCTGRKVTAVPTHPAPPWPSNLLSAFLGSPSLLCGSPAPLEDLVPVRERPAGQLLHGLLPLPLNRPCRLHGPHPQACLLGPPGGLLCGGPLDESRGPHAAWPSDSWHNRNLSGWFSKLSVGACCVPVSVLSAGTRCGPDMGWGWGAGGEVDAFLGGQDAGGGDSWPMGG